MKDLRATAEQRDDFFELLYSRAQTVDTLVQFNEGLVCVKALWMSDGVVILAAHSDLQGSVIEAEDQAIDLLIARATPLVQEWKKRNVRVR